MCTQTSDATFVFVSQSDTCEQHWCNHMGIYEGTVAKDNFQALRAAAKWMFVSTLVIL